GANSKAGRTEREPYQRPGKNLLRGMLTRVQPAPSREARGTIGQRTRLRPVVETFPRQIGSAEKRRCGVTRGEALALARRPARDRLAVEKLLHPPNQCGLQNTPHGEILQP